MFYFWAVLLVTGLGATVFCGILDAFTFREGFVPLLLSTVSVCGLYLPVCRIFLPLFIKLGVEKARFFDSTLLNAFAHPASSQLALWMAIAVVVLALCIVVSYSIAVKLYICKEF